jgi:hypothetical protein
MCGAYCGFVPMIILIGAAVGLGGFGPLSMPPNLSQSTGHCWTPASKPAETRACTTLLQASTTGCREARCLGPAIGWSGCLNSASAGRQNELASAFSCPGTGNQ